MKFGLTPQKLIAQVLFALNCTGALWLLLLTTFCISERTKVVPCVHALYCSIFYCGSCASSVCDRVVLLNPNSTALFSYNCWSTVW